MKLFLLLPEQKMTTIEINQNLFNFIKGIKKEGCFFFIVNY
jgi:hypothetical protein